MYALVKEGNGTHRGSPDANRLYPVLVAETSCRKFVLYAHSVARDSPTRAEFMIPAEKLLMSALVIVSLRFIHETMSLGKTHTILVLTSVSPDADLIMLQSLDRSQSS